MKKLLLLSVFCFSIKTYAQTAATPKQSANTLNKYLVKIDSTIVFNNSATLDFIKQISAATFISFNTNTKYFEVLTKKTLEKNIIEGKLRKNMTPMIDYVFVGEVKNANNSANSNDPNSPQ